MNNTGWVIYAGDEKRNKPRRSKEKRRVIAPKAAGGIEEADGENREKKIDPGLSRMAEICVRFYQPLDPLFSQDGRALPERSVATGNRQPVPRRPFQASPKKRNPTLPFLPPFPDRAGLPYRRLDDDPIRGHGHPGLFPRRGGGLCRQ